jgi:hypothetical protein
MSYGELKIDTITFTSAGVDTSISVSGLVQNPTFTGNITTTGTISGDVIRGNTVSGATVTGDAGEFGTITGNTAGFTTVTGTTVTGTTANFVTVSGTTVTGTTANFVTVSGTTVTGDTGQFTNITGVNIVGTTQVSGATVTGNIGLFTTITGGIHTLTSGVFASGTAANPSITFVDDLDTGLFTGAANTVSIGANGGAVLTVSGTNVGIGTSNPSSIFDVQVATSAGINFTTSAQNPIIDFFANSVESAARINAIEAFGGGRLRFSTKTTGGTLTERLSIDESGDVGIGTTSPNGTLSVAESGNGAKVTLQNTSSVRLNYIGLGSDDDIIDIAADENNQGTNSAITLRVDGSERARIDSSGRVGIGVTNPDVQLSLTGSTNGVSASLRLNNTDTGGRNYLLTSRNDGGLRISDDTAGSERLRIDSSGRLLVGTTTSRIVEDSAGNGPQGLIQIEATNSDAIMSIISAGTADANRAGTLSLGRHRNSTVGGTPTIVQSGDTLGAICFAGGDGTDMRTKGASIVGQVDGTPGADDMPGRLVFSTTADGASIPTERMRIASSGRVGIGTTNPSILLDCEGSSTGDGVGLHLNNTDGSNTILVSTGSSYSFSSVGSSTTWLTSDGTKVAIGPYTAGEIQFINGGEKARIDSSGRLLVGTTSSFQTYSLFQVGGTGNKGISIDSTSLANGQAAFLQIRGTVTNLRYNEFGVYKHSGISEACGYLQQMAQNGNTYFTWVDDSGQYRISTSAGNIGTTGGTVIGTQTSDERIKNILGPVEYGLDILKQIEPVRFSLKAEPGTEKLGFIAQQVLSLVPESVFDTNEPIEGEPEDAQTKLGMEYVSLIPVLVNAIKELSAEVDSLKAQLQAS